MRPLDLAPRVTPTEAERTKQFHVGVGTFKITDKAIQYVNQVLRSERLSYGPFLQKFESQFAAAHGCRFATMTNSGTSSLLVALHALKLKYNWKDGDEVIVPAVTFVATANVVLQLNLHPVFVDVDPLYYELDPKEIEKAITPRTRCIIPVHLFGHPCDMDAISDIASRHRLSILEDSCETMFTKLNGESVGAMGDIACFSTYIAHLLCTGVGGLCTTNDPDLAVKVRSLANHGRDSIYLSIDDDNGKTADELKMIIKRRFSFVEPGYSFRVTEMEGALGLAEMERADEIISKRRQNARYYSTYLSNLQDYIQLPSARPGAGHAYMMYPIVLKNEKKDDLVNFLENNGIETRDMLPLVNQPIYKKMLGIKESDYPVAKWVNESGFYIGSHQDLRPVEREYVVEVIQAFFKGTTRAKEKSSIILMSNVQKDMNDLFLKGFTDVIESQGYDERILVNAGKNEALERFFSLRGYKVITQSGSKGTLLKKAVGEATGNLIVTMGIDGSDDPSDAAKLLTRLKSGKSLVTATRFMEGSTREVTRPLSYRAFGNRFFSFLVSMVTKNNVTDAYNNFRAFRRDAFLKWDLASSGPEVMVEMTVKALAQSSPYSEEPTHEKRSVLHYRKNNRFLIALKTFLVLLKKVF